MVFLFQKPAFSLLLIESRLLRTCGPHPLPQSAKPVNFPRITIEFSRGHGEGDTAARRDQGPTPTGALPPYLVAPRPRQPAGRAFSFQEPASFASAGGSLPGPEQLCFSRAQFLTEMGPPPRTAAQTPQAVCRCSPSLPARVRDAPGSWGAPALLPLERRDAHPQTRAAPTAGEEHLLGFQRPPAQPPARSEPTCGGGARPLPIPLVRGTPPCRHACSVPQTGAEPRLLGLADAAAARGPPGSLPGCGRAREGWGGTAVCAPAPGARGLTDAPIRQWEAAAELGGALWAVPSRSLCSQHRLRLDSGYCAGARGNCGWGARAATWTTSWEFNLDRSRDLPGTLHGRPIE